MGRHTSLWLKRLRTAAAANPPAVVSKTATSVTLNWSPVLGVTTYTLQHSTTFAGPWTTVTSGAVLSATDTALTEGTTYYYRVVTATSSGVTATSSVVSATTAVSYNPPATPTGLIVSNPTSATLDVSWDASTSATKYVLLRRPSTLTP